MPATMLTMKCMGGQPLPSLPAIAPCAMRPAQRASSSPSAAAHQPSASQPSAHAHAAMHAAQQPGASQEPASSPRSQQRQQPAAPASQAASWAQAMLTKSDEGQAMDDALTASERRLYMIHRIVSVMTELTFGLNSACMNLKLINMSGGNMAKIATAHAWHWCCNAGLKIFTTPLFAALSDSFGRIPFWAIGRFSYFTYFLGLHLCRSLPQFSFVMVFGQCIMPAAASLTVQAAAWSDAFGSRPALSANLQARTQFWVSAGGLVGPMVGGLLATRSHSAGFFVCMGLCLFQSMIVLACEETLPPPKRKPFAGVRVAANPVRGLRLLFTHGPGLRRLALVGTCTARCLRYPPFPTSPPHSLPVHQM
eukprot:COSAG01_NODE_5750_length_4058_cov_1.778030_1_plen_365_part_00